MPQSTLSGNVPTVYELRDNSPLRHTEQCVYHDRATEAKHYSGIEVVEQDYVWQDSNLRAMHSPGDSGQYRAHDGRCKTTPRYVLDYGDTKFLLCWKHVPKELKENNFGGVYGDDS